MGRVLVLLAGYVNNVQVARWPILCQGPAGYFFFFLIFDRAASVPADPSGSPGGRERPADLEAGWEVEESSLSAETAAEGGGGR